MRHVFLTFKGRFGGSEGTHLQGQRYCQNSISLRAKSDHDALAQLRKGYEHLTEVKIFVAPEGEPIPGMLYMDRFRAVSPSDDDVLYSDDEDND